MKQGLAAVLLTVMSVGAYAQYEPLARNAFMHQDIQQAFEYWNISRPSVEFHSSFRPYLSSTFAHATDSVVPFRFYAFKNFFLSKTLNEKPQKPDWYQLQLHPLADVELGYDALRQKTVLSALGGTHLKLNINNDFTFAASVFGGKSAFPFFMDTSIRSTKILPAYGQGYGSSSGYNFWDYTGYASYSPNNSKIFNLQLGRDKHFIGEGYRSLLLSDYAPAYPYFRLNANLWHIQYNAWYTWMYDATNANGLRRNYSNKFGTFHYLSYNIIKELNIGLFENIIWRGTDTNQVRTFEVNYLNPVIFMRPQEYSVGSPDNSFIGINLSGTLFRSVKLYAQLALDEFFLKEVRARRGWWANKQGWQLGGKYINAFGINGLKLQAEYNEVRPYTYSHGVVQQNYAHYGAALAHPFGANFRELQGFIHYHKNSWELSLQGMYALVGKDSASARSNVGQNIFLSYTTRPFEYGHKTTQGIKTTLLQSQIKFTYFLIPDMNMRVELGYIQRTEKNTEGYLLNDPFIFLGFKTSFWNTYRD